MGGKCPEYGWLVGCALILTQRGGGRIESWVRRYNSENQRDWNPKIVEYCRSFSFSKMYFQVPAVSFLGVYFWLFVSKKKQKGKARWQICLKLISTLGIGIAFPNGSAPVKLKGVVAWTDAGPHNRTIVFQPFFFQANSLFFFVSLSALLFHFHVCFLFFEDFKPDQELPESCRKARGEERERFVEGGGFSQAYLGGRCPASSVGDYVVEKSTPSANGIFPSEVRTVKAAGAVCYQ